MSLRWLEKPRFDIVKNYLVKKNKSAYVQANREWLVAKTREDGVMALPGGVYYKVLAEGYSLKDSGVQPRIRL